MRARRSSQSQQVDCKATATESQPYFAVTVKPGCTNVLHSQQQCKWHIAQSLYIQPHQHVVPSDLYLSKYERPKTLHNAAHLKNHGLYVAAVKETDHSQYCLCTRAAAALPVLPAMLLLCKQRLKIQNIRSLCVYQPLL